MRDAANNPRGARRRGARKAPPGEAEGLREEARQERTAHAHERSRLEQALREGAAELARARQEAAGLREHVARFQLEVDARLRSLARKHLHSERVIEALPVAIAYLDRGLVCRWANVAFVAMAGRPRVELVGRRLTEIFPQAPDSLTRILRALFAAGPGSAPVKLPFLHGAAGAGTPQHWDVLALPMLADGDSPEGILLAIEVTERVEAGRAQAQRIERLTELDRLKGDFISMVSHELRTPLSAIAGYAEFLEEETHGPLTPTQKGYVQAIQAAEGRIRGMVDDLLDFARLEAGTFQIAVQPVDLMEVVRHALVLLLPAGRAGRVTTAVAGSPPSLQVLADPARLLQVLLNVIGNAIKFTPAGGSVAVSLERRGAEAWVAVHDTGIGIPPEALGQVFDRFYQVDSTATRARGGVGLGLAIAKSLVERQGGQMGVESEPGKGTTFWFTLPAREAAAA